MLDTGSAGVVCDDGCGFKAYENESGDKSPHSKVFVAAAPTTSAPNIFHSPFTIHHLLLLLLPHH
jgi:hypothetical protein